MRANETLLYTLMELIPENFWTNAPCLNGDEKVLHSYLANYTHAKVAVGGKLFITNYRIIFAPNRFEHFLGREPLEIKRSEVELLYPVAPDRSIAQSFSGAWVQRLCFKTFSNLEYCFVVNNINTVLQEYAYA